jgi:hypothetical protein
MEDQLRNNQIMVENVTKRSGYGSVGKLVILRPAPPWSPGQRELPSSSDIFLSLSIPFTNFPTEPSYAAENDYL